MSVQAWFSNDEATIAPGDTVVLPLTVHNLGEATESYTIVPAGLTASWTTTSRGNLTLFGGSQEVVEVSVTPPVLPSTSAGPTAISIRIIPLGDSDDAVVAEETIYVDSFDDCRIVTLQPVQRARHRATYEFMVENHGNTVASCRLHLIDPTERVDGDFDPPAVGVAPGGASLVRLRTRAERGAFRRSTRQLDFEVEASRQGLPPVSAPLTLVQSPTIPRAAIVRTLAVIALLGGLALAWFALVEPAIQDAVADQVDERLAGLEPSNGTGPSATTTVPTEADEPERTPSYFRLTVGAALNQTADQTYTIPDGETFDITDLRVENPFNDSGVATLLVNSEQVFIWSLDNVRGSHFEPRITPLRVEAGDNVTFSVRCDEIGDATRATCTNAVNVGGEILTSD